MSKHTQDGLPEPEALEKFRPSPEWLLREAAGLVNWRRHLTERRRAGEPGADKADIEVESETRRKHERWRLQREHDFWKSLANGVWRARGSLHDPRDALGLPDISQLGELVWITPQQWASRQLMMDKDHVGRVPVADRASEIVYDNVLYYPESVAVAMGAAAELATSPRHAANPPTASAEDQPQGGNGVRPETSKMRAVRDDLLASGAITPSMSAKAAHRAVVKHLGVLGSDDKPKKGFSLATFQKKLWPPPSD